MKDETKEVRANLISQFDGQCLFNIAETAQIIGMSVNTFRNKLFKNDYRDLPNFVKRGRIYKFHVDDIAEFLSNFKAAV